MRCKWWRRGSFSVLGLVLASLLVSLIPVVSTANPGITSGEVMLRRVGGHSLAVVDVERGVGEREIFNIGVSGTQTYYVGEHGLLAHNASWLDKACKANGVDRSQIPAWQQRPHGHHVIPKGMNAGKKGAIARELRNMANRSGMPNVRDDPRNLAIAPNGMGTHSEEGLQAVYDRLKPHDGDADAFLNEVDQIRQDMLDGSFYRDLGTLPP